MNPERIVSSVLPPPWFPLRDDELYVNGRPNISRLQQFLAQGGKLSPTHVSQLTKDATEIMKEEPNLLRSYGNFIIVGDLHGQYYDLYELLLREWKDPVDEKSYKWVFLGDYVDRGSFGLEIVILLFAYKIAFPDHVYLMRGNHECRSVTAKFNFKEECLNKYTVNHYNEIMTAFDALPLACILTTQSGNYFIVHGGLSPEIQYVDSINTLDRFMEPPKTGALCDFLWSDPLSEDTAQGLSQSDMQEWYDVDYCENPTRGVGQVFGYKAVKNFLSDNDLVGIIRGHEVAHTGKLESYMCKEQGAFPLIVTLFSAPNYCGWYNNTAAVLVLHETGGYEYRYFEETKAPFVLPSSLNGFSYSLPWITEQTHKFVKAFFGLLIDQLEDNQIAKQLQPKLALFDKVANSMKVVEEKNDAAMKLKGLISTENTETYHQIATKLSTGEVTYKEIDTALERSPLAAKRTNNNNTKFWRHKELSVDDLVYSTYNEITDRKTPTCWASFIYDEKSKKKKLILKTKGSTGIADIIKELLPNERAWVYSRLGADLSQPKYVLITWIPERISPIKRAESLLHKSTVHEIFTNVSIHINASDVTDIDEVTLHKKIGSFGGTGYNN
jgi:serine/threonine-protein phosphatase 2B catalytic subunit